MRKHRLYKRFSFEILIVILFTAMVLLKNKLKNYEVKIPHRYVFPCVLKQDTVYIVHKLS